MCQINISLTLSRRRDAAPYNPRTAVYAFPPGMSQGDEIIFIFSKFDQNSNSIYFTKPSL